MLANFAPIVSRCRSQLCTRFSNNFHTRFPISLLSLIVVLSFYGIFEPDWFTTRAEHTDPWLYWGTAEAFDYVAAHFQGTYYFRRWTLYFPQMAIGSFTGPLTTQWVLQSAKIWIILALMLSIVFCTMPSPAASTRTGVALGMVASLFAMPYFILAWTNTYHEGVGTIFFLALIRIGLAFRTHLQSSRNFMERRAAALAFAGGIVFGLLIVSYQFLSILLPSVLAVAAPSYRERKLLIRVTWTYGSMFALGVLALIYIDLLVGKSLGFAWPNLVTYSIAEAIRIPDSFGFSRDIWAKSLLTTRGSILPLGIFLGLMLAFAKRIPGRTQWGGFLLLLCAPYILDMFRGGGSLFYTHQHLPIYVGVLLVGFILAAQHFPTRHWIAISVCLFAFSVFTRLYEVPSIPVVVSVFIWFLTTAVILLIVTRSASPQVGAFVALLAITLTVHFAPYVDSIRPNWDIASGGRQAAYERLHREFLFLSHWALSRDVRLFVIDARMHSSRSPLISAFYGDYTGLVKGNPGVWNCSWGDRPFRQDVAIAVVGDYSLLNARLPSNDSLEARTSASVLDSSNAIALDRDLRACGFDPLAGTNLESLFVSIPLLSSDQIWIYGYR